MKKLLLLVGVAVGFVLGSKMGREPYERMEAQLRQLAGRPEVKDAVDAVSDKAADLTDTMAGVVKMAPAGKGPTGSIDQSEIARLAVRRGSRGRDRRRDRRFSRQRTRGHLPHQ